MANPERNPETGIIVATDCDNVLGHTTRSLIDLSNLTWGCGLRLADYTENWEAMWGCDTAETRRRADHLIDCGFYEEIPPMEGAHQVIADLSGEVAFDIATSRASALARATHSWRMRHFQGVLERVHHAGIWDDVSTPDQNIRAVNATKGELLRKIGADVLIDDEPKHCIAAAVQGVGAIMFGDYPWQQGVELPPGVVRAPHWQAVGEVLHEHIELSRSGV